MHARPANRLAGPGRQVGEIFGYPPATRGGALIEPGQLLEREPLVIAKGQRRLAFPRFEQHHFETLVTELVGERTAACSRTNDYNDGIIVRIESSHYATLRSARFRACLFWWIGQPIQIVEAVMQVTAEAIGRALVAKGLPDFLVVIKRDNLDAANFFKKRRVLYFLERGNLSVCRLGGEFAFRRMVETGYPSAYQTRAGGLAGRLGIELFDHLDLVAVVQATGREYPA